MKENGKIKESDNGLNNKDNDKENIKNNDNNSKIKII